MVRAGWMLAAWCWAMPVLAQTAGPEFGLQQKIATMLADSKVARDHWGVAAYTLDGRMLAGINEGQLFLPESTEKLFTISAALSVLGDAATLETRVVGRGVWSGTQKLNGDVVIVGGGDANLSGRELPYAGGHGEGGGKAPALRYLEQMADAVAATGLKTVTGDVVGNDTLFPWEPYGVDWSVDDLVWGYGAPVSALSVNDNQLRVVVAPGAVGASAVITVDPTVPYYTISNEVTTVAGKRGGAVQISREPGSRILRVYGTIAAEGGADAEEVAIHDPAEYAAMAFKAMLEDRGIEIKGVPRAEHRMSGDAKGFQSEAKEALHVAEPPVPLQAVAIEGKVLATHSSAPLGQDAVLTMKVSQNMHAEMLLRDLGSAAGEDGSAAQGVRVVRAVALQAGVSPEDMVFYDGSGMSGHDLVTSRAEARLLRWAQDQPWGELFRASLPLGGVDGTLAGRFTRAPLKGKVWAKTGTNSESRVLSGYVECASGQTVVFSVMVGSHPPGSTADREVMDRIVEAIAAGN